MNRLNLVTLGVKNLATSIAFYKNSLGFDVHTHGPDEEPTVAFFNNEGSKISLFPIEQLAQDIYGEGQTLSTADFSGFSLAYNVKSEAEVDALFLHLKNHDVTIVKPPQHVSWGGYSGYFQDPDGYYWEVAYGDMWAFDEQNMLVVNSED